MKKQLVKISCMIMCLFGSAATYAQGEGEAIYSYDGDNNIIPKSKFVGGPTFTDDYTNVTPYVFTGEEVVQSKNYLNVYWIKMYKYKGFENDPGFCNVIDIVTNGTTLLQVKDPGGWENIKSRLKNNYSVKSNRYILSRISKTAIALIFSGHTYQNDPPMLTIIVIDRNKATLVYNKPMSLIDLTQTTDSFSLTGRSNSPEINGDGTPVTPYIKHKIWSEDGIIRFKDL